MVKKLQQMSNKTIFSIPKGIQPTVRHSAGRQKNFSFTLTPFLLQPHSETIQVNPVKCLLCKCIKTTDLLYELVEKSLVAVFEVSAAIPKLPCGLTVEHLTDCLKEQRSNLLGNETVYNECGKEQ